jgi:hypothetical protein
MKVQFLTDGRDIQFRVYTQNVMVQTRDIVCVSEGADLPDVQTSQKNVP